LSMSGKNAKASSSTNKVSRELQAVDSRTKSLDKKIDRLLRDRSTNPRPKDSRQSRKAYQAHVERTGLAYLHSILDPFNSTDVRIPSIAPIKTSTFQCKDAYTVTLDDPSILAVQGGLAAFNPYANFASTGHAIAYGRVHPYRDVQTGAASSWPPTGVESIAQTVLPGAIDAAAVQCLDCSKSAAAILAAYSAVRFVSGGIRFKYAGPILSAQGRLAVALYPGSEEYLKRPVDGTGVVLAGPGQGMVHDRALGFTFEEVISLQGAKSYSTADIIEGVEAIWKPQGEDVKEWLSTGRNRGYTAGSFTGNNTLLGSLAEPPSTAPYQESQASTANMNSTAAEFGSMYVQQISQFARTSGSPIIVWAFDLPAGSNPVPLEIEVCGNYEGIPRSRSWSIVSSEIKFAAPHIVPVTHAIAAVTPDSTTKTEKGHVLKQIASQGAMIMNAGKQLYSGAQQYAAPLAEMISDLGATFGSDALAGAGEALAMGAAMFL
jgi:hypothetical protein